MPENLDTDPTPFSSAVPEPLQTTIAHAILSGAAAQLVHGTLCDEPRLSLQVNGPKRRVLCICCQQTIELPVGDDYDAAWRQIGQRAIVDAVSAGESMAREILKSQGCCEHGIPMTRDCTQCAVESSKMIFLPGGPQALNGRMQPPPLQS